MFPCKVKIGNLDRTNEKVKDVEFNTNKALTKGKIKKVATKEGERTPFYYLGGYFEKNGKAVGDFLSLGNSLKLEKHFVQNEMKRSKKSFMDENQDPKKATMGEIYIKKEKGVPIICFEPHEKSKIPMAKWPKILKGMKAYFLGMKAIVVTDSETVEEEEDTTILSGNATEATAAPEIVEEIDDTIDPKELTEDYKDLLAEFKEAQKAEHDVDVVKLLYKEIIAWKKNFIKLDSNVQEKLVKFSESCEEMQLAVKKIVKVDQNIGEDVVKIKKIVMDYLAIDDHTSSVANALKKEADDLLLKLSKYCKFVNAKKLTKKCDELKELLAA